MHPPQRSDAGVLLVPLDRPAIDLVWHESGYPAHGDYRDSHRLTERAHAVWANDGEPYDPARGAARARLDAQDFVANVSDGAVVAFDTELFGHHWHEGVAFLEAVLELADVVPLALAALGARPARGRAADELGRGARPADLERAGGRRAGLGAARCRARRARRGTRRRVRCASCWRCRVRTGRS